MAGLESDTIGGYNSFLAKQSKMEGDTLITTVLFDDQYEILYNGVDIAHARLQEGQYLVRGMTALNDAVGKTILDVGTRIARTPEAARPGKVIMIIATDGAENASREFPGKRIQEMIAHQRQKFGWEVLFFGANIDTQAVAANLGISQDCAMAFTTSSKGITQMMENACLRVEEFRKG